MWRVLVILWLTSLVSCTTLDDKHSAEDSTFDPQLSEALQVALEEAAKIQMADSISASLYISDSCHWEGTTGATRPDLSIPVEPGMLFGFASITKTFVAGIVLQLVEENRLGLDDPLGRWLGKYPNIDSNITIRQLLNHGSGLYNYTENDSYWSEVKANPDRVWSPGEVLKYVDPLPKLGFDFPRYSNTNYTLLGMIIEAATGNSLEQELQNRIIGPIQLESTFLAKNDFNPKDWANSTALSNSEYSSAWADGAIVSTSKDIAKWSHALYSGSFLHATSLESMFTLEVRRSSSGYGVSAGLGVFNWRIGQFLVWGHSGWFPPFASSTFYIPELGLSVAYASSVADRSGGDFLGPGLLRAYINNRPDNISTCFDS